MTIGQAIRILEEVKELDDSIYSFNEDYMTALDIAIRMLEDDAVPIPFIIDYLNYGGEDKISSCLKEWEKQNERKNN